VTHFKMHLLKRTCVALLQTGSRLGVIALVFILFAKSAPALAHASLLETSPIQGAVLRTSPETIHLRFNESIAPLAFSFVQWDGTSLAPDSVEAQDREVRITPPHDLLNGTILMNYRIVSADGHPVSGVLVFSIGSPNREIDSYAARDDARLTMLIWLMRWIFYCGLLGGLGGVFCHSWLSVVPQDQSTSRQLAKRFLEVGLVSSGMSIGLNGADALGLGILNLFQSPAWLTGWQLSSRFTFVFAGFAMLIGRLLTAGRSHEAAKLWSRSGLFLCLAMGCYALTLSGHASTAQPQTVTRPALFLHLLCVALWIGALPVLYEQHRDNNDHLPTGLSRFSNLALPIVGFALIAGLILSRVQLGEIARLLNTDYGRILCAKVGLVTILLALAAANRWLLVPRLKTQIPWAYLALRRSILGEILGAVLILAVVGLWRFTPPARVVLEAQNEPAQLHIHSSQAMADVTISPGRQGRVKARLFFQTGDFTPLNPMSATLYASRPQTGIEAMEIPLEPNNQGAWESGIIVLPQAGDWHIRLDLLIDDFTKVILEDDIKIQN